MHKIEQWRTLAKKSMFRVSDLAQLAHSSPRQLQRLFKRELGQSPKTWLDARRAEETRRLLRSGFQIKTIALRLGFRDCSQFCAWFKKRFKTTPCEWRAGRT